MVKTSKKYHTDARSTETENMYASPIIINESHINNNNNNDLINNDNDARTERSGTTLQQFYAGQNIFLTGGTGFLGKILIEKLLRSCPDLATIYILVRPKGQKDVQTRVEEIFDDVIYDRLKQEVPKFRHKIIAIAGDCSVPNLGLSLADRALLIREVSIAFHVAATVRFDEKLKFATAINVQSASDVIDLCKSMPHLKALIHVSTAYANCHVPCIDEKFYTYNTKHEDLIKLVESTPDNSIDELTPKIIGEWPNTYAFTKAIAEDVVRRRNKGLAMGIFRPAVVVSTAQEPVVGWIDNLYGPTGVVTGAASGVLKTFHCDPKITANIVPVDLCVNALIASAWDVSTQVDRRDEEMLIYNYVSSVDSPLNWGDYCKINLRYGEEYPLSNALWCTSFSLTKHKILHWIYVLFLHLLPAILVDTVSICVGQKPRLWKMYQKIHKFSGVISYFCTHEWKFTNNNVHAMWKRLDAKDKQLFRFTMEKFEWDKYFQFYIKGIRVYLLKDDLSNLEASRSKRRKFYYLHTALKCLFRVLAVWFLWTIFSRIFF